MRGKHRRRYALAFGVVVLVTLGIVVPAPAAPVTITVPYSTTPVADGDLDGNPSTGAWSDAQNWTIPLENGRTDQYGSAKLFAKHDGTYVYFRVDGKIDVLWASSSGNHFWFGIEFSSSAAVHHTGGTWDGIFFGEDAYTSGPPLVPVDTNGFGKPPTKDTTQDDFGRMQASGSGAPYGLTAEWKRKLTTGDAKDITFTADGTASYYFYATTDSDGGGSGGGGIDHSSARNDNIIRFAQPPAPDPTPPTVTITAPAAGAFLRQNVLITATASDNVGVTSVTFLLDGTTLGSDTTQPYEYAWDTTTASNGPHTIRAEARDAAGNVGLDQVGVMVDNAAPTAVAGADRRVSPGTAVTFDGSGSTDNIGIATYAWAFTDGGPQTLTGVSPTYTFNNVGNFLVTLTVADAAGNSATDTLWVNVSVDTAPPVARAGPDQAVLQGTLVILDGTASMDDVGIDNYTWAFNDGGSVTLWGAIVQHRFLSVRSVAVALTVRDFAGKTGTDGTWVNVSADTVLPVADAGPGQSIDFGMSATLNGSGSTDNVGIANYTWTFMDGAPVTLWGPIVSHRFRSVANFSVSLTVLDYAGNSAIATTYVNVTADSAAPVAKAGPDVTIRLGEKVTLNGTNSTDNVGIVSYTWAVQGTSDVLTGVVVTYQPPAGGMWTIILTVADAAGNTATDEVLVTVIAPDVTAPAAPSGLVVTTSGPGSVTLTWTANGEADLAGYLVFRMNSEGTPVQLNAVPMMNTTFVDAGLVPGDSYTYIVKAVDRAGNISGPSPSVAGSAGLMPPAPFDWMSIRWIAVPGFAGLVLLVLAVFAWREERRKRAAHPQPPPPPPGVSR